ncbi:hypothetical protein HYPSUDRAFT_201613 [Hypholoma sublateritium FD-334 SS-4]|uniref:Uncharacterized protein n=1 Tax=Hypholoma sublateritium (strain FD-334 SS-4) TaxID=945553 RepID=A0A0D2P2W3_HYPSF|nr:hypothetical protein HYPSUDRAFT_201613 [Hypholoma sublateritium FD-334 SS-4]
MDGIQVLVSTLSFCRSPLEAGYDLDDMNNKGAFNHSSLQIIKASELVEPAGWYLGRLYYVVTKGLAVGVFHNLSEVRRSVQPFPVFRNWTTCKTWVEAVKSWDISCRTNSVSILRMDSLYATARAPTPRPNIGTPASRFDRPVALIPSPTSAASTPSGSVLKRQLRVPSVIVVSDSDSDGEVEAVSVLKRQPPSVIIISDSDSDSEVEATFPKPIVKKIDCFEVIENENGCTLRQIYDAATDTDLDTPTEISSQGRDATPCSSTTTLKHTPPPVASGSGYKSASTPSVAQALQGHDQSGPFAFPPSATKFKRSATKKPGMPLPDQMVQTQAFLARAVERDDEDAVDHETDDEDECVGDFCEPRKATPRRACGAPLQPRVLHNANARERHGFRP